MQLFGGMMEDLSHSLCLSSKIQNLAQLPKATRWQKWDLYLGGWAPEDLTHSPSLCPVPAAEAVKRGDKGGCFTWTQNPWCAHSRMHRRGRSPPEASVGQRWLDSVGHLGQSEEEIMQPLSLCGRAVISPRQQDPVSPQQQLGDTEYSLCGWGPGHQDACRLQNIGQAPGCLPSLPVPAMAVVGAWSWS